MAESVPYPVINVEEVPDKIVGKRRKAADPFDTGLILQETSNALRKAFGQKGLVPKGVFRFRTHEEADEWMLKMLARYSRKS
jgi:hypothetical protein